MAEYGDRCQGEFAGPRKSPKFRTTQNGHFQDPENGVFSGPPKKRPIFGTTKKEAYF